MDNSLWAPACSAPVAARCEKLPRIDTRIQPLQSQKASRFSVRLEKLIAQLAVYSRGMINFAIKPGRPLRPGRAEIAYILIFAKSGDHIAVGVTQRFAEHDCIFNSLSGALSQIL